MYQHIIHMPQEKGNRSVDTSGDGHFYRSLSFLKGSFGESIGISNTVGELRKRGAKVFEMHQGDTQIIHCKNKKKKLLNPSIKQTLKGQTCHFSQGRKDHCECVVICQCFSGQVQAM